MLGEYDSGYENYIDSLIREIEKLQDENDKLSEQVSSLVGRSFRTADKMSCIEADNAKLREQVERLRTQLADMTESVGRVEERCAKTFEVGKRWMAKAARFEAENTKLRELVRDMWEGYNDPRCEECHLKDTPTCADCPICAREASVIDRMRELGVDE